MKSTKTTDKKSLRITKETIRNMTVRTRVRAGWSACFHVTDTMSHLPTIK